MAKRVVTPEMLQEIILEIENICKEYKNGYYKMESIYEVLLINSNGEDAVLRELKKQLNEFSLHMNKFSEYLLHLTEHMNKAKNIVSTPEKDLMGGELFK